MSLTAIPDSDEFPANGWTTAQLTVIVTFVSAGQGPEDAVEGSRPEGSEVTPEQLDRAASEGASVVSPSAASEDREAQDFLIGANVVSFVEGFTTRERQDIVDSMLLASRAATAKVKSLESLSDARSWFDEYFDTLSHLGFTTVESGVPALPILDREFDFVDMMVIVGQEVAYEQVDPSFLVSIRALARLRAMQRVSPSERIINDHERPGRAARLQMTVISRDSSGQVKLVAMPFAAEAKAPFENILSAKFRRDEVMLDVGWRAFVVDMRLLEATREAIAGRLAPYRLETERYVRSIPERIDREASE